MKKYRFDEGLARWVMALKYENTPKAKDELISLFQNSGYKNFHTKFNKNSVEVTNLDAPYEVYRASAGQFVFYSDVLKKIIILDNDIFRCFYVEVKNKEE